jgi:uncharacterized DUF497 family protein
MQIVWDEIKRQANIKKHRLDFAALDECFSEMRWWSQPSMADLRQLGSLITA